MSFTDLRLFSVSFFSKTKEAFGRKYQINKLKFRFNKYRIDARNFSDQSSQRSKEWYLQNCKMVNKNIQKLK